MLLHYAKYKIAIVCEKLCLALRKAANYITCQLIVFIYSTESFLQGKGEDPFVFTNNSFRINVNLSIYL